MNDDDDNDNDTTNDNSSNHASDEGADRRTAKPPTGERECTTTPTTDSVTD